MHAKLLCQMDRMPIELKGYAKHVKPWHKEHMEYDGTNKGIINQDGKHHWYLMMQSMSKLKKEEKIIMSKTLTPQKLMIIRAWCTMSGDVLNLLLLCTSNHNHDKEHADVVDGMGRPLV
jgi:hypothetical protein